MGTGKIQNKIVKSIKSIFSKTLTSSLAVFLLGLFVLLASQSVYSQDKKIQQKTVPKNISKGISKVIYVDPFAESVKQTVDRIKKSDRLIKLMATPRNKKSTQDLITQKKLLVKIFSIPVKKKLPLLNKQVQKNVKSAKTTVAPATKKLNPPSKASGLKQQAKKTTVNKLKNAPTLSAPAQTTEKVAQSTSKSSGSIGFNHLATGFPLTGSHFQVSCDRCHVGGVFRGTSRRCFSCHTQGGLVASTPKSSNHIQTNTLCANCHTTDSWSPVLRVDHSSVTGTCLNCHNNVVAVGKSAKHIQSSNQCDSCHTTTRWTGARFDHAGVTGTCSSCHNGTTATGKSATHLQTSNTCQDCHVTTNWTTVNFDHAGVTGTCST